MAKKKKTDKPVGTGSLFPQTVHDLFMSITGSRYSGMVSRMKRKKLPPLQFSLKEFRDDILGVMGGKADGAIQCRYCHGFFTLDGISVDHAKPLSRGGDAGLSNLDYPCRACNQIKGSMDVGEFTRLLSFLETIPLARTDVIKRLQQSVALAAGARSNMGAISELKKNGQWQAVQASRRAKKKAKMGGSTKF